MQAPKLPPESDLPGLPTGKLLESFQIVTTFQLVKGFFQLVSFQLVKIRINAGRSRHPRRAICRRSWGSPSPRKLGRRGDLGNVASKAWAGRAAVTPLKSRPEGRGRCLARREVPWRISGD